MYECPLTSQEDKKKIYELKRTARSAERVKQHGSDVTQAHNSEAKPRAKKTPEKKGINSNIKKSSEKAGSKNVTFKDAAKSKSYASVAQRRTLHATVAEQSAPLKEGNVEDLWKFVLPPIGEDEVLHNPSVREAIYEA